MNDLLLQRGVIRAISAANTPCTACPQANRGGFCGAHIHPKCLRIDREGRVRVSLAASPQAWFESLSQFGEVIHQTRNPVGIVGWSGKLPTLAHWEESPLPIDATGGYRPNLAEYASVWAIRENSPVGALYGLEVCDATGTGFERILLPASAVVSVWAYGLVRDTSGILLDRTPESSDLPDEIQRAVENDGDSRVNDLHVWQLASGKFAAIVSIVAHEPKPAEAYRELFREHEELVHVTVEVHRCPDAVPLQVRS